MLKPLLSHVEAPLLRCWMIGPLIVGKRFLGRKAAAPHVAYFSCLGNASQRPNHTKTSAKHGVNITHHAKLNNRTSSQWPFPPPPSTQPNCCTESRAIFSRDTATRGNQTEQFQRPADNSNSHFLPTGSRASSAARVLLFSFPSPFVDTTTPRRDSAPSIFERYHHANKRETTR